MHRTYVQDIPVDLHLTGFDYPRRTQIPLDARAMGDYAAKLDQMARQGASLPPVQVNNPWKKPKEVFLIDDEQQFPAPRQPLKGKLNQTSTPSNRTQQNNTIQQRLRQMELAHEQRLKESEQKHNQELEETMASFQNQQKLFSDSMEKRLQESHDTLRSLIEQNQRIMSIQMNELMDVVQKIAQQLPLIKNQETDEEMQQVIPQGKENRPNFDSEGSQGKKSKITSQLALRPSTLGSLVGNLRQISGTTITPDKPKHPPQQRTEIGNQQNTSTQQQEQTATHTTHVAMNTHNEWS